MQPKAARQSWWKLLSKSIVGKIFEEEIFIRILQPTLLQIFSKIILNLPVNVKGIKDPDDNFKSNS